MEELQKTSAEKPKPLEKENKKLEDELTGRL